jgi:hypothetical protein
MPFKIQRNVEKDCVLVLEWIDQENPQKRSTGAADPQLGFRNGSHICCLCAGRVCCLLLVHSVYKLYDCRMITSWQRNVSLLQFYKIQINVNRLKVLQILTFQ